MREGYVRRSGVSWIRGLLSLIAVAVILVAVIGIVGLMAGWIDVSRDLAGERTIIEVQTGEMREAAKDTVQRVNETGDTVSEKVGEALKRTGEQLD